MVGDAPARTVLGRTGRVVDTEVIVVGGGPVGLTLAHELGSRGVGLVLVEPRTAPDESSPRCKQVNPRSMEHFRRLGVADAVRAHAPFPVGWSDRVVFCTGLAGEQITRFDGVFALSSQRRPELPEPAQWTAQYRLEQALRATLTLRPSVTPLWGERVVGVAQDADAVTATVVDADGGTRTVRARYLAAADGGRSAARRDLGIALRGSSHTVGNLQVVFDAPGLAESHDHGEAVQYWVLGPGVGGLLGRLDTGDAWWAIIIGAPQDASTEWVSSTLRTMTGTGTPIRVRSRDPWTARMLVADRYRAGRCFLAGDAAHLNPPWGGFGANTGIGDGVDLGWKLAATVQGWGGAELLDSYEAERRPFAVRAVAEAEANMAVLTPELAGSLLAEPGERGRAARKDAAEAVRRAKTSEFHTLGFVLGTGCPDSPIVVPDDGPAPISTTSDYRPSSAPGMRMPHVWTGPETSIYDALGPGLTLVDACGEPAPARWRTAAERRGVPWTEIRATSPETRQTRQHLAARYLLVRPDHLVAWRGTSLPPDPDRLLDAVLGTRTAARYRPTTSEEPTTMPTLDAEHRAGSFVPHAFDEHTVDLGEIRMNYAVAGDPDRPALLLIPGQTESWWGYERAMRLLAEHFHVHAVDLRGQGRSTWTPGRYTLDILGNDLVRFIDLVIGRPVIVSGLSSGGVLAAWLSAYAKPGQVRAAVYEDPPLFASETTPACGPSIRQGMGPVFAAWSKWLGDQWTIGDWDGLQKAFPSEIPTVLLQSLAAMAVPDEDASGDGPPQSLREYDPEWGRSFVTGRVTAGCDHATMLAGVRVPVLFTHHGHRVDPDSGHLLGAISDLQARRVRDLVESAGQPFTYRAFPDMPHSLHGADPETYARTLVEWASALSA